MTDAKDEAVSVRAVIRGRVQGVWFRAWTVEQATRLNLSGWVRNRADGAVEAVFFGSKAAVAEMLTACNRGPTAARVDGVDVESCSPPGGLGFVQRASV